MDNITPYLYTDTEMIDWLQSKLDLAEYTGRVVFRWSDYNRGWRLHETSRSTAVADVRQAIMEAILRAENDKRR